VCIHTERFYQIGNTYLVKSVVIVTTLSFFAPTHKKALDFPFQAPETTLFQKFFRVQTRIKQGFPDFLKKFLKKI